jgi:nitroreductase
MQIRQARHHLTELRAMTGRVTDRFPGRWLGIVEASMDTVTAVHTRRSIRDYEKRAVPREIIAEILWDAAQAPTTPVSGPFLFHVIEGVARIAGLGERAKQYAREHRPDAVAYSWTDRSDFKVFLDAPVVIVISGHADNSQSIQDCNRAGQNLMLSAHARGLGSCWVGAPMLWLRSPETRKELGIAKAFEPFAAFTLGYAASVPPSRSRERPEIVWP